MYAGALNRLPPFAEGVAQTKWYTSAMPAITPHIMNQMTTVPRYMLNDLLQNSVGRDGLVNSIGSSISGLRGVRSQYATNAATTDSLLPTPMETTTGSLLDLPIDLRTEEGSSGVKRRRL